MFGKYSKWEPLFFYEASSTLYCVMGRRNIKTGMLYFKTKPVNTKGYVSNKALGLNKKFTINV